MRLSLLVVIGQICCFSCLLAQSNTNNLRWHYLTVEEGLLNNYVTALYQDHLGFMWVGTKGGLNRYNGYEFESFRHQAADTNSLSSNVVSAIIEDSFNQLWVGTENGLNLIDKNGSGFIHFQHGENQEGSLASNEITVLFEDGAKNLWVGSQDGTLHLFNRDEQTFTRFFHPAYTGLRDIIEDRQGRLVLGFTSGGLIYFDKENHRFQADKFSPSTAALQVTSLLEDRDGDLWIGTNDGLFGYQSNERLLIAYPVAPGKSGHLNIKLIFDLFEQDDGTIWVTTDGGGINILDKTTGIFSYLGSGNRGRGLNSMAITRIYWDRSGGLWVGTVNGGLNQLKKYQNQIDHYTFDNGNPTGLSSKSVLSMWESSNGNIWVGLDQGGLNYLDRQTERFVHYMHDPQNPNSIIENVVNDVYEDSRGDVYIGTYLNGFDVLDEQRKQFKHLWSKNGNNNNTPSYVKFFLEDSFGGFWIGTANYGLILFDRDTQKSIAYDRQSGGENQITSNHITYLFEDRSTNLWVGTTDGLNLFDRERKDFQSWLHLPEDTNSINSNLIITIFEDEQGMLWIGTDRGLNRFDRQNNTFSRYTMAHGLPGNMVKQILPGNDQHLWISTDRGICRFSIVAETAELLSLGEDIKAQEFGGAALKTQDGKLWFGSVNGIYSFYPEKIRRNPVIPPVVITKLLIANQEVKVGQQDSPLLQPIGKTPELTLTHEQSSVFTFEFVALNYTLSQNNEYAYKLEGFEEKWNYVGTQRNATYTNIDPGGYIFKVKGSNNDGLWNEEGTFIHITILAPWWKTNWAYALYVVILILTGLGIRFSEKNRMKLLHNWKLAQLEKEKAEEINQIKLQFFTNISHEFKTPLTLILGPLEKIISSGGGNTYMKRQFQLMRKNVNRLLRLIDQLIEFRKAEVGQLKIRAEESDLIPFVKNIVASFSERATDTQISLTFYASSEHLFLWFDREKLDKVLFNLLSNSFKYTDPGGEVTISVRPCANYRQMVEISVEDTGRGIAPQEQNKIFERFYQVSSNIPGSGIGLSLSKALVELHHGEIGVHSEVGKGSQFTIRLPLGKEHLAKEERLDPQKVSHQDPAQTVAPLLGSKWVEDKNPLQKAFTLLIVEDDWEVKTFLRESLERCYNIVEAANGQEGLEKAKVSDPDLIISDIMMPVMDGFEFCKHIKTNLSTSHIPVILLTARTGEESQIEGLDTGADDYLTKPFNPRLLEAMIKNLISSRKKLKDRFLSEFSMNANEITITSVDEQFMIQAVEIVESQMANQEFTVETLVKEMAMSRSVFSKKLKALSGQSPAAFIRTIKLKKAALLLIKSGKTITEISHELGFITPKTFRTQFKKQFGQTPSDFINVHKSAVDTH